MVGLLLYEALVIYSHVNEQGLHLLSISFLGVIVICAALPTIFACFSLWRGFGARHELALR